MVMLKLCAPNDPNGNPRRVFVAVESATDRTMQWVLGTWDEGYEGTAAVPEHWRALATHAIEFRVLATTYEQYVRWGNDMRKRQKFAAQ